MLCLNRLLRSAVITDGVRNFHVSQRFFGIKQIWHISSAQNIVDVAPKHVQPYLRLMRVDKPIGTWLLYFPCTWSIALATPAGHLPDFNMLLLFGAGSFFMRSAGCIINDMWDKDYDKKVMRTKTRPLASGEISQRQGLVLLASLLSASALILFQLNWLSVFTGVCSLALVVTYPLAKRYTYWPQAVLGCTFNWGILLGYTAVTNTFDLITCLPLYLSGLVWTLVYDTIYAHQDKADDAVIGVKSTALKFGDNTKLWLGGFSALMVSNLALVGYVSEQTLPFYMALSGVTTHLMWQVGTVDTNNGDDCWQKFRSNQYIGIYFFLGIVLSNLFRKKTTNDLKE